LGLFAAAVLAGTLIAVVSPDPTRIKTWLADRLGFFIGLIIFLVVIYSVLWLHFADIVAPSKAFRLANFLIRLLAVLPLMIAAGAVGFESVRWMLRIHSGQDKHIVAHGIGVSAAGLLVLGLFLFQDDRMSGLINSVKTPVFSVELKSETPTAPVVGTGSIGFQSIDSKGEEDDPVLQSIAIVRSLASAIARDFGYSEALGQDRLSVDRKTPLENDRAFFASTLQLFGECVVAIRKRVRDRHPLIFLDRETAHLMRVAHRQLLNGQRSDLEVSITYLVLYNAQKIIERINFLREQHENITSVHVPKSSMVPCDKFRDSEFIPRLWLHLLNGGLSADGPYVTLLVAAALNMIEEKLSAVEEIDLWLKRHRNAEKSSNVKPDSADGRHLRIMRMRAEYWAGRILSSSPEFAVTGARRYRRALQAIEEILPNIATTEHFKTGVTLPYLIKYVDRRSAVFRDKTSAICFNMPRELKYLILISLSMINSITFIAATIEPQLPNLDFKEFMLKYHAVLGSIEPACFKGVITDDFEVAIFSAFLDTYMTAKLRLLRDMPKERALLEMCEFGKVLDSFIDYTDRLKQLGRVELDKTDFWAAEELLSSVRTMLERLISARKVVESLGARAC
jgi:hypothetical protein